jgi:hypothetical protein
MLLEVLLLEVLLLEVLFEVLLDCSVQIEMPWYYSLKK